MKRIALIIAASLALPFAAQATGTGIGVAHGTSGLDFTRNDTTIFVPIAMGSNLWIEPFFSYANVDVDNVGDGDATTVGVGLFSDVFSANKTSAYVGGRVGYVNADFNATAGGTTTTNGFDGWSFSPTLGFGYSPVPNLFFGAEAFVTYNTIDNNGSNNDISTIGTGTNLFARYFFNVQ